MQFLHKSMMDEKRSRFDRVFIGHLLHMIYARARFSDLLACVNGFLDEECMFLELEATVHKGSRTATTKAMLLPVVAPANGITNGCWAKDYLVLREMVGLKLPKGKPEPMLPAPERGGSGWQRRYLTSQEMNAFLKKLFQDGGIALDGRRISTHSCKATCISWCSKHDVSPEHRAVLARHSTATQGPTALYSRDLITAALRSLVHVIDAIKAATFQPDRSRSGMITPVPAPRVPEPTTPMPATPLPATTTQMQVVEPVEVPSPRAESIVPSPESPLPETPKSWVKVDWTNMDLDAVPPDQQACPDLLADWENETEGSSSTSESDSDVEVQMEVEAPSDARPQAPSANWAKWFINGKTLVNHERKSEVSFKCGRTINASYFLVHTLTGLRCAKCFVDAL